MRGRLLVLLALLCLGAWPVDAAVVPGVVEVRNNFFDPQTVRVAAGSTVRWTAMDGGHTVTADDGRFDFGPLRDGETAAWTAGADETVRYHCRLHSGEGMVGTIVVGDGGAPPPVDTAPVLHVPAGYPTIAAAVASAAPGSVVRVAAGVYAEAVEVATPGLTIEGVGDVVLDGGYRREIGIAGRADGLLVKGVTVRRYLTAGLEVGAGGMVQRVVARENPVGIKAVGAGYVVRDSVLAENGTGLSLTGGGGDVIGNTVAVGRVGAWVDGAEGVRVSGNRVEGGRMGIVVTGPSRSVSVVDNVVGGSTQADLAYDGLGVDVCFTDNGDAPKTEPAVLPSCDGPLAVGIPDPLVHVWLRT